MMTSASIAPVSRVLLMSILAAFLSVNAYAGDIRFAVQPILDEKAVRTAFEPLAEYLTKACGKKVDLKSSYDFADYWYKLKRGTEFNMVLDGPFYTDYLIQKQAFVPLAKVNGVVSHSLIALPSSGIFDPSDLVGKPVATLIPPAPAGLLLAKLFSNPARQPYIVATKSSEQALSLLMEGKVIAAMVPTPLAAQAMAQGKEITTVTTSPQIPHIAISVGPSVDAQTRAKITAALLDADKTPEGQAVLKKMGFVQGFEPASAELFRGYSKYLDQEW